MLEMLMQYSIVSWYVHRTELGVSLNTESYIRTDVMKHYLFIRPQYNSSVTSRFNGSL